MGHNAFFIKNEFLEHFKEVPNKIEDIYVKLIIGLLVLIMKLGQRKKC